MESEGEHADPEEIPAAREASRVFVRGKTVSA